MSHWFDRLAAWSAGDVEPDEATLLTRRQAVQAATGAAAGIGVAGLLGGPLANPAAAIFGGTSPQCKCMDKAERINDAANYSLFKTIGPAAAFSPAAGVVLIFGLVGTSAAFLGQLVHCGLCKDDPPLNPPPPSRFQPCTQRGGIRLRGDQCGGGSEGPSGGAEGGTTCGAGTASCPVPGDGDRCCFGEDLCCSGCCCIAAVGCGCCG